MAIGVEWKPFSWYSINLKSFNQQPCIYRLLRRSLETISQPFLVIRCVFVMHADVCLCAYRNACINIAYWIFVEWFICDFVSVLVKMQAIIDLLVFKEFVTALIWPWQEESELHLTACVRQWGGFKYSPLAIMTEDWKLESILVGSSHCIALLSVETWVQQVHGIDGSCKLTALTPKVVLINMSHSCLRRQNVLYPSVLAQVGWKMGRSNSLTWVHCLHLT